MDLQNYIGTFILFLNVIVQFLIGIAFLLFVFNAFRFFIVGGADQQAQQRARSLATYGVLAFVVLIIFFGVVNLLASSSGLSGVTAPTSDYILTY